MLLDFLKDNLLTVFILFFSIGMLVVPPLLKKASGYEDVTTLDATKLINDNSSLVLDVRTQAECSKGCISNRAKNIQVDQLMTKIQSIEDYKSKPILVYCQSGMRSAMACRILRKHGFEKVFNLAGGVNAWVKESLPLETVKAKKS